MAATVANSSPAGANVGRAACAKHEQAHGIGLERLVGLGRRGGVGERERRHGEFLLAGQPQRDPAGGEDLQPRAGSQQIGDHRRRGDEVLEVVEHQEKRAIA
jgi:hypothetical protein